MSGVSANPEQVTSLPEPINTAMAEVITAIRSFYKVVGRLGVLCQEHQMNKLPIVWALEASMADIEEDDLPYIDPEVRAGAVAGMFLTVMRRMEEYSDYSDAMAASFFMTIFGSYGEDQALSELLSDVNVDEMAAKFSHPSGG